MIRKLWQVQIHKTVKYQLCFVLFINLGLYKFFYIKQFVVFCTVQT